MWDVILLGLCVAGAVYGIAVNINIYREGNLDD